MLRWTPRRKADVIKEVQNNPENERAILERNEISAEEFASWCIRFAPYGEMGLKTTKISAFRKGYAGW